MDKGLPWRGGLGGEGLNRKTLMEKGPGWRGTWGRRKPWCKGATMERTGRLKQRKRKGTGGRLPVARYMGGDGGPSSEGSSWREAPPGEEGPQWSVDLAEDHPHRGEGLLDGWGRGSEEGKIDWEGTPGVRMQRGGRNGEDSAP